MTRTDLNQRKQKNMKMVTSRSVQLIVFLVWTATVIQGVSAAELKTIAGKVRSYTTLLCAGIEWDISGDTNHNATCTVQYRKQGENAWKPAMPLMRIDSNATSQYGKSDRPYNMLAGSVFFLEPGTDYELKLNLEDPDGGSTNRTVKVRTWNMPRFPKGGKAYHVKPGNGGGDGSKDKPFLGIASAQAAAQPGDIMLLHAGNYGRVELNKPGVRGKPIVWKSAGDGEAVVHHLAVTSWLWIDGLFFRRDLKAKSFDGIGSPEKALTAHWGDTEGVCVTRCTFRDFWYSIWPSEYWTRYKGSEWYIADNDIIGNKYGPLDDGDWSGGEGIELEDSSNCVVCYNRISRVADGISYAKRNCDIYGNEIFKTTDDGIEPDYGYANIRMWGNRIYDVANYSLSFQPQFCGPWYFFRNQVDKGYKHYAPQPWYSIHNTTPTNLFDHNCKSNELMVSINDLRAANPADFTTISKSSEPCEVTLWRTKKGGYMTLKAGSKAINAGQVLPNINDPFVKDGKPDLGAYEYGQPLPQIGPRSKEFLDALYEGGK
jgi:parallel beta-helix repeat protein